MTATMPTFNPFDPTMVEDPYPVYARLREGAAVHRVELMGMDTWVLSKFDDVSASLRNHEVFSSGAMVAGGDTTRSLISTDPPDHTKLRRLVSKPFQPSAIAAMEPRIRDITNQLVVEMIDANRDGTADLVHHLSYPLPMTVIAEMLGIPVERRADFRRWSEHTMGTAMAPTAMTSGPPATGQFVGGPEGEMSLFFEEVVNERRRNPGDDLISALVTGKEALSHEEVLMFCVLLLIAGNETTTNLISNAALAFFENPEQAEVLASDPSLVPSAMEEALRYDSPVQFMFRQVKTDTEIRGQQIAAGSGVLVLFGSANRDADKYPDPESFDVRRNPKDHVAFGAGIHLCLGAALARLESKVAWETLLERTRNLRPAGPGERSANPLLRGMRRLPIAFDTPDEGDVVD
jgi:cytochrome P450